MTHTPGPWKCGAPWAGFSEVVGPDGELVFGLAVGSFDEKRPDAECEANARLIAAAPDLLAALRVHREWTDKERAGPQYPAGVSRDNGGEAIWRAWWDEQIHLCRMADTLTRAALAKAEGVERDLTKMEASNG